MSTIVKRVTRIYSAFAHSVQARQTGNTGRAAALCLLLTGTIPLGAALAAPKNPGLIVPGQSFGPLRLGSRRAELYSFLGKPAHVYRLPGGLIEDVWEFEGDPSRHFDIFYRSGVAVQIGATASGYATALGLSAASPFQRALLEYPGLTTTAYYIHDPDAEGAEEYFYDDARRGIAFSFSSQDDEASSEGILGTNPEADVKPEDIIVHSPGRALLVPAGGATVTRRRVEADLTAPYLYAHLRHH